MEIFVIGNDRVKFYYIYIFQILVSIGEYFRTEVDAFGYTNQCKTSIVRNNLHVDCSSSNLTDASFQSFIDTYENISMIVDLNLAGNHLTKFVDITRNGDRIIFPELLYLTLSRNSLQEIPPFLPTFAPKLLILNLTYNLIATVSSANFVNKNSAQVGIPSLFNLILSNNRINKVLGNPFKYGFGQLRRLYLDYNRIDSLDAFAFRGLSSLILLDLQSNMIKSISAGTLNFSNSLSFINLDRNRLREIWSYTFINFQQMSLLSLASNNISRIFNHAISNAFIRKLDLSHNELSVIPKNSFVDTDVARVFLNNNPSLVCSCLLKSVINSVSYLRVFGTCILPQNSTGGSRAEVNRGDIGVALPRIKCDGCSLAGCADYEECKVNPTVGGKAACACIYGISDSGECNKPDCHNKCHNSATCSPLSSTLYKCICRSGYTGVHCKSKIIHKPPTTFSPTASVHKPPTTFSPAASVAKVGEGDGRNKTSGRLSVGVVIVISVGAFLIGTLMSLFVYYKITKGSRRFTYYIPFFIKSN